MTMFILNDLFTLRTAELRSMLADVPKSVYTRNDLIRSIIVQYIEDKKKCSARGIFEAVNEKWGFLRYLEESFRTTINDIYISGSTIKQLSLREGDELEVELCLNNKSKHLQIVNVITLNNIAPADLKPVLDFRDGSAIFPSEQIVLAKGHTNLINRIIDLMIPLGYGQRGIIASPPKAGKTSMIESMAQSCVVLNKKNVIVLMIAERPEEHIHFSRKVPGSMVLYSSFDESPIRHVRLAALTIAYALRKIERGEKVILFIDSLTRYVRAVNLLENSPGKMLTGGLDSNSLLKIKQILGAARNLEDSGSLTIIATMLIHTGSKMDDIIFDESRGTSNWDLVLNEDLSSKNLHPAVDISQSSARRSDLMMSITNYRALNLLRQVILNSKNREEALVKLMQQVKNTASNEDILRQFR